MWQKIRSGTESKGLEIICLVCLVWSAFKKYIVCFVLVLSVIEWRKKAGSVNFGGSSGSGCVTGQWSVGQCIVAVISFQDNEGSILSWQNP